ncbi:RNase adapter RapZ [Microbacterium sp. JB110]|uniref:RNase adapter RapZ n=1 Tax=Microbacterium sp. JB110 TaxID=2024477 RepID=UPI00097ECD13|nr:RNase adapter RapZ [Microbacterium sp. JB110]RCS63077.1 RNase adapter RapZ [Microbacterium sp. JB110]SJM60180.1 Predicted P-loop-containing kinase [Frigoribacterium sp. JB110]
MVSERRVPNEVLIVTGMSGAGRSTVANALEDLEWYVVDNLPPQMLGTLLDLTGRLGQQLPHVAAVVDVRGRDLFGDLPARMAELRARSRLRVVFLDASDDALVRRFEQVRRPHPLQGDGTILDGIARERRIVAPIRENADVIIDTTQTNMHQLATRVDDLFAEEGAARHTVTLMSFGYKYGLPTDVDLVADMRFLPNPFWEESLRHLSGEDEPVREFVLAQEGAEEFLDAYSATLRAVISGYERENKRHSTVGVGCTGGRHRSVAMVRELATRLAEIQGLSVKVQHRDIGRD